MKTFFCIIQASNKTLYHPPPSYVERHFFVVLGSEARCCGKISRTEYVPQTFIEELMIFRGPEGYLKISRTRLVESGTLVGRNDLLAGVIIKRVVVDMGIK